jgi:hypothetical protein
VALRAVGPKIIIHPYIFRQVCRNGAIIAASLGTQVVERCQPEFREPTEAEFEVFATKLCAVLRRCTQEPALTETASKLRLSMHTMADMTQVTSLSFRLESVAERSASRLQSEVSARFSQEPERSVFALMNAVTALARDIEDPEIRWRLEEIGGEIGTELAASGSEERTIEASFTQWLADRRNAEESSLQSACCAGRR